MTSAEPSAQALSRVVAIVPARDEAAVIADVVRGLRQLDRHDGSALIDEVLVVDNGSTDGTAAIAVSAGARVVHEPRAGYGAACLAGIAALGVADIVVFVDGDGSVASQDLLTVLAALPAADLVIGSRRYRAPGAMTLSQSLGTALAAFTIRLLWRSKVTDLGPLRALRTETLRTLRMRDRAFGWTVEMQVRALQSDLRVVEVPVHVLPRVGRSKISGTWRGVLGAAHGIFSTIGRLWVLEQRARRRAQRFRRIRSGPAGHRA